MCVMGGNVYEVGLESGRGGSVREKVEVGAVVVANGDGAIKVMYTVPRTVTFHEGSLAVCVNGKHICGSPFCVRIYGGPFTAPVFCHKFGGKGSVIGQFSNPIGVVVSQKGEVFVCNYYNHCVGVFTLEGKFL